MTRDELIETMAKAVCDQWGYLWNGDPYDDQTAPERNEDYDTRPSKELYRAASAAALTAIEAAGYAVVPREPTPEMIIIGQEVFLDNGYTHAELNDRTLGKAFTAMLAASPLAEK